MPQGMLRWPRIILAALMWASLALSGIGPANAAMPASTQPAPGPAAMTMGHHSTAPCPGHATPATCCLLGACAMLPATMPGQPAVPAARRTPGIVYPPAARQARMGRATNPTLPPPRQA